MCIRDSLWGSQTDASRLVHSGEHVVGQADQRTVHVGYVGRRLAQDRIADESDLVGCHGGKATVGAMEARMPDRYRR